MPDAVVDDHLSKRYWMPDAKLAGITDIARLYGGLT
jgi:hypothetical protein